MQQKAYAADLKIIKDLQNLKDKLAAIKDGIDWEYIWYPSIDAMYTLLPTARRIKQVICHFQDGGCVNRSKTAERPTRS